MLFEVVTGGGHFRDRPFLPEVRDFSNLSLSSLVKLGFAALDPISRGTSHMYQDIDKMLEEDVIEPSNSDWSHPVVMNSAIAGPKPG